MCFQHLYSTAIYYICVSEAYDKASTKNKYVLWQYWICSNNIKMGQIDLWEGEFLNYKRFFENKNKKVWNLLCDD